MTTLGIDARMIRHTGIGTYLRGFLGELNSTDNLSYFKIKLYGNALAEERRMEFPHLPEVSWEKFTSPIYSLSEQLQYRSKISHCDIWHAPHYNIPVFKGKSKLIVTIHDLIHWIFRKDFFTPFQAAYAGGMLSRAVRLADFVITVSNHTRSDLVEHFGADPAKIRVIYEGVDPRFCERLSPETLLRLRKKLGLPDRYFLYVGSLKKHKNILVLVRTFRELWKQKRIHSQLVVAGRKDKKYSPDWAEIQNLVSEEGVVYLSSLGSDDLPALYQAADALVHPSLYEGFGLTVLEAMASGTPVIAAKTSSLPEVAGNAALWFNPGNKESLAEVLKKFESDSAIAEDLKIKGFAQAQKFSWSKTARETEAIYQMAAGK